VTQQTSVLTSLNAGLRTAMTDDERVIVLGEDVLDPYGGAFKVTRGLSSQFPDRVLATPISEAGIVAVATGLALRGYLPVVEIMFGDFLFLAGDQIVNHAAKYRAMFDDKVRVPLVIRTPMGGRRGYGPTHSQSLEKHFLGVPGLWVVAPHALGDPGQLLRQAIFDIEDPVLFVENKIGYGESVRHDVPGYDIVRLTDSAAPFATVWLKPQAPPDGLIMCYGGMTTLALGAAQALLEDERLAFGVVVVSQLAPMPASHIDMIMAAGGTSVIVTVEEAHAEGGWGAEMIATIEQIRAAHGLDAVTYRRVGAKSTAIPSGRDLEDETLPQVSDIVAAVLDCF
jgi:pyruvate/2-oxoglutarate/acetoin dehydrogenase E1 component